MAVELRRCFGSLLLVAKASAVGLWPVVRCRSFFGCLGVLACLRLVPKLFLDLEAGAVGLLPGRGGTVLSA